MTTREAEQRNFIGDVLDALSAESKRLASMKAQLTTALANHDRIYVAVQAKARCDAFAEVAAWVKSRDVAEFVKRDENQDYPLIQGIFLIFTVTLLLANFAADALYVLFDPRVRVGARQ